MANSEIETSQERWQQFFRSLLSIHDDCEQLNNTTNDIAARENLLSRFEIAVLALNQAFPMVSSVTCRSFLEELGNNFRLLYLNTSRTVLSSAQCTNLAIYFLEAPPTLNAGSRGRPRLDMSENVILELRSLGFKWKGISDMLLVSRWTIRRRVIEYGIQDVTGFSQ